MTSPAAILAISPDLALLAEYALIELLGGSKHSYLRARRSEHGMPRVGRKALNANFAAYEASAGAAALELSRVTGQAGRAITSYKVNAG